MAELNLCFNLFSNKYANERIMRKGKHWATSLAKIWGFGTYSKPVTIIIIIIIIISLAEKRQISSESLTVQPGQPGIKACANRCYPL